MRPGSSFAWVLALILLASIPAGSESALPIKPYRVLVVVEQWDDPASVLVDSEKDEFQPVVALLKAWCIPFDIFRLDQQHLVPPAVEKCVQALAKRARLEPDVRPVEHRFPDLATRGEKSRREGAERGVRTFDHDGVPVGHVLSQLR